MENLQKLIVWLKAEKAKALRKCIMHRQNGELNSAIAQGYKAAAFGLSITQAELLLNPQPNNEPQQHWQEWPAQKPKSGELTVMKFDEVGFFVQYYYEGLEDKYGPFQKFIFIQLPTCH